MTKEIQPTIELTVDEAKGLLDYLIKRPYVEVQSIVPALGQRINAAEQSAEQTTEKEDNGNTDK